ncbi:MAG: ATP-binding protein [bacterium]
MKIKSFITSGFIGFAILTLIVGSIALINLNRINSSVRVLSEDKIIKCRTTEEILKYIFQANLYTREYLITHGEENIRRISSCINNTKLEIDKLSIEKDNEIGELRDLLSDYEEIFKQGVEEHDKLTALTEIIRSNAREIEGIIPQKENPDLLISFLQVRRQEKNLMLYGAQGSKFDEKMDELYPLIENDPFLSARIIDYHNLMKRFISINTDIESIVSQMLDKDNQMRLITENMNRKSWEDNQYTSQKVFSLIKNARYGHILIIFFIMVVAGLGLVLSNYISKLIYQPMENLTSAMQEAKKGDLSARADIFREDELGHLARGFNLMMDDIEKSNNEIKTLQAQLIQSERLACLGEISAGIAHEINNPLGGILIYSNLLFEEMADDNPQRESLMKIIHETNRCKNIVKELLDFARQTEPKTEVVDINRYIQASVDLISKQAKFNHVDIRMKLSKDLPGIKCDASQLQQVFLNILINAAEAMEDQKSGRLDIESRLSNLEHYIEIEFRDTGSGISKENLDRIYNPFFTTKPPGKGTGLGLSVSYGIIKKHQGLIDVKSEEGKGTTFTIRLREDYEEC